jgi:hypothetical protein
MNPANPETWHADLPGRPREGHSYTFPYVGLQVRPVVTVRRAHFRAQLGRHAGCIVPRREGRTMYPYGISIGGIVLLIVLIMLLTGRI